MRITHARSLRRGFTLTELLVSIAIVAVLVALAFTATRHGILSAKIAKNLAKSRDLGNLFTAYAAEYGHYPPGWDPSYGLGPTNRNGAPMNGRGPDLVNAFQGIWAIHEGWLSPVLEHKLVAYEGNAQPTNYTGHPALCYNGGDQQDPYPSTIVQRPAEVFLLCDGVPKGTDTALNSQTGMRQWYSYHRESNPERGQRPLPIKPIAQNNGNDLNGPDFRNRGKCHVTFCDGHTESFGPDDFKVKHVALRF